MAACTSSAASPAARPAPCDCRGKLWWPRWARGDAPDVCVLVPTLVCVVSMPAASLSTAIVSMDVVVDINTGCACAQSGDIPTVDAAPRWLPWASYAHSDEAVIEPSAELTVRSERLLLCREAALRGGGGSTGPQSRYNVSWPSGCARGGGIGATGACGAPAGPH